MNEINFKMEEIEEINLKLDTSIKEIYPLLTNLEVIPTKEKQIFNHDGAYGYDKVVVNSIILQDKEVIPSKEEQTIKADENYSGLNQVKVKPITDEYVKPIGIIDIKENGEYDVTNYKSANVNIGDDEAMITFSNYNSYGFPTKARINKPYNNNSVVSYFMQIHSYVSSNNRPYFYAIDAIELTQEITSLGACSFAYLLNLKNFDFSNIENINNQCFNSCGFLSIELPKIKNIYDQGFWYCSKLEKVIITNSIVPTLGTNVFTGTKIASGTGYIYVPDELVDNYKTATNWSTYANQIKPISELEAS